MADDAEYSDGLLKLTLSFNKEDVQRLKACMDWRGYEDPEQALSDALELLNLARKSKLNGHFLVYTNKPPEGSSAGYLKHKPPPQKRPTTKGRGFH